MPIPTDTFWNIKRLNIAFAVSAVLLLLTMVWSVVQDYDKTWRQPQRDGKVWEAALTQEKIDRDKTPEKQQRIKALEGAIQQLQARLDAHKAQVIDPIEEQIRKTQSDITTLSNKHNDRKSNVSLAQASYEEARAAGRADEAEAWQKKLDAATGSFSRQLLKEEDETLAQWKDQIKERKAELAKQTDDRDRLEKEKKKLTEDREALLSKEKTLVPSNVLAQASAKLRATPLLQFINPAEKPDSRYIDDVLTDLGGFKKVTTVDRCVTCHVNIGKKDFAEERVLAYLERQVAGERGLKLPPPTPHADDPTSDPDTPGAVAMAEFWHAWGQELLPPEAWAEKLEKDGPSLDSLLNKIIVAAGPFARTGTVSKDLVAQVQAATDQPALLKPEGRAARDKAVPALLNELYTRYASMEELANKGDNAADQKKALEEARAAAVRYPTALRQTIDATVAPDAKRLLLDRYRRALVAEVNAARDQRGESPLDDGRVLLAHPNLRLYVDADSKHPMDSGEGKLGMGCTSCHDGSGQETNFVLAAHMPRRIWVDEKTGEPVFPQQLKNPPKEDHRPTMSSMLEAVYPEDAIVPNRVANMHLELGEREEPTPESSPAQTSSVETAPEHAPATAYVDPVTGKTGRAVPQAKYWADKYEAEAGRPFELVYHEWDWPMRPPQYLQANCVRCHTNVNDVQEYAQTVAEGRLLFTNFGCVNCHNMDSIPQQERHQVGPDLRHVTSKLSPSFINTWVFAPKSFRPSTKMPHFFLLENNSSDEEIRRTRQEARAITEYLVRTATPMPPKHVPSADVKGDPKEGEKLFRSVGCMGCHTNLNVTAMDPDNPGTPLEGVTVAEQWITTDLVKKGELARELRPKVTADVTKRLTEGLEDRVKQDLAQQAESELRQEIEDKIKPAVTEELTPKDDAGKPKKLSAAEKTKLTRDVAAEVKKRAAAEYKKVSKEELPKRVAAAQTPEKLAAARADAKSKLPGLIADTIESELADKVKEEAKRLYNGMTYNERQLYALRNFDAPHLMLNTPPRSPEEAVRPPTLPRYADGSPRPLFVHHGPELSGIGTKLLAGRTPEQARAWLFEWLKEPRHYSAYTVMPNLRLTDQEAMNLVEHLLAQRRDTLKTYDTSKPTPEGEQPKELPDAWAAGLAPVDARKQIELVAFFLRSRYSAATATRKADDLAELKNLAAEAITTPVFDETAARALVEAIAGTKPGPTTAPTTAPTIAKVAVASADPAAGVAEAGAAEQGRAGAEAAPATQPTTRPTTPPTTQPTTQPAGGSAAASLAGYTAADEPFTLAAGVSPKDELRMLFLGKKLIAHYGCMSCHAINGAESLTSPCADLSDWGQKQVSKLDYAYLDPHKVQETTPQAEVRKVPVVNGLSAEASHLAHMDLTVKADAKEGDKAAAFVTGNAGRISRDVEVAWPEVEHTRDSWITQKLKNTRVYDRGRSLLEPSSGDWHNPDYPDGKPYDKLKMPTFYLSDEQVHAIVTWVLSNRDRLVSERMLAKANTEQAKQIAYGRFLTQKYNCIGCHQTEKNVPAVQQYYKPDELTQKAPPSLRGEGNRIQHDWLVYFIHNVGDVGPIRPTLQPAGGIRMPTFPMDRLPNGGGSDDKGEEAKAIAAYFAAASNREAEALKKLVDPIRKYHDAKVQAEVARAKEAAKTQPSMLAAGVTRGPKGRQPGTPPGSGGFAVAGAIRPKPLGTPAGQAISTAVSYAGPPQPTRDEVPADEWFRQPTLVETARVLKQWALETRELAERDFDPFKNPAPGDIEKSFGKLLFKAAFLAELYEAPFPFVDKGNQPVSDEEFKKGEQLFYTIKCTQCHTITPDARDDPSAARALVGPNLGRVPVRIQRRWARYWIQEPPTIQIDTKMIPFFTGLDALKLRGVAWHPTLPPEQATQDGKAMVIDTKLFDERFGDTAPEQIEQLLNYIYGADQRHYTAPAADAKDAPASYIPLTVAPAPATQPAAPQTQPAEGAQPEKSAGAAGATAPQAASAGQGQVSGVVKFKGKPPARQPVAGLANVRECAAQHKDPLLDETVVVSDDGMLANVVVYVSNGLPQQPFAPPPQPAVLDQKGCQYVPHVVAVMVGQDLVAKNSDTFLHNVHTLPANNPVNNTPQPTRDENGMKLGPIRVPEKFKVKCDVHPWMSAWVVAVDNPFFGTSGEDGAFTLRGLPPGKYTLTAWHEKFGEQKKEVTVKEGEPAQVEFEFASK